MDLQGRIFDTTSYFQDMLKLMPQIRRVSRRHCALYKFTYLLTYLYSIHRVQRTVKCQRRSTGGRPVDPGTVLVRRRRRR